MLQLNDEWHNSNGQFKSNVTIFTNGKQIKWADTMSLENSETELGCL
jgi:hypothetical protein